MLEQMCENGFVCDHSTGADWTNPSEGERTEPLVDNLPHEKGIELNEDPSSASSVQRLG